MKLMEIIFWTSLIIIAYSYFLYGILVTAISKISAVRKFIPKPKFRGNKSISEKDSESKFPYITMIISACGESRELVREKIRNTENLIYPANKLEIIFAVAAEKKYEFDPVLDELYSHYLESPKKIVSFEKEEKYIQSLISGRVSNAAEFQKLDDHFTSLGIKEKYRIKITKDLERKGKMSQLDRTLKNVNGEIIVFSDLNSMFNREALLNLSKHFANYRVGCVAGEKKVKKSNSESGTNGEGLYWRYESMLKKADSDLWTAVGAAGEIYAIRKNLWNEVKTDNAIIEDFVISMRVAEKGYRVIYEKNAFAEEEPSKDLKEEFKRRKRIAAGGFQSIVMLKSLFNIFKYRVLSFQFISHRVLRWAVVPFLLPLILVLNIILAFVSVNIYQALLAVQIVFYIFALTGYILEGKKKIIFFYYPFFLLMLNIASYSGLKRYLLNQQSTIWEKAKR